jgi:hypothetical protein
METLLSEVVSPASETGLPSDKGITDFEKMRKSIFGTRNKSAKTPKTKETKEVVSDEEITKLFSGENWEELSSLYFNARFATTGYEGFLLSESQKKVLGLSLATSMKLLIKIDPGYLALLVFTTNFGGIIASKELEYSMEKKKNNARKSA